MESKLVTAPFVVPMVAMLGAIQCGSISLPFYAMVPMVAMFEIFSLSRD